MGGIQLLAAAVSGIFAFGDGGGSHACLLLSVVGFGSGTATVLASIITSHASNKRVHLGYTEKLAHYPLSE